MVLNLFFIHENFVGKLLTIPFMCQTLITVQIFSLKFSLPIGFVLFIQSSEWLICMFLNPHELAGVLEHSFTPQVYLYGSNLVASLTVELSN